MIINPSGAESLDGVKMVSAVIPKGRMRGDVDGDGRITYADADLIPKISINLVVVDNVSRWCADINCDGVVTASDNLGIQSYLNGNVSGFNMQDYYNNWTFVNREGQAPFWTADISIPGLTVQSSATIVVSGEWAVGMFSSGEIIENGIRIRSVAPPIADAPCTVFYGEGDGSVVVCGRLSPTPDDIGAARAPKIVEIELPVSGWNTEKKEQSVLVDGVSKFEANQIIQFIPDSGSAVEYLKCGIARTYYSRADNTLLFHADTIPENDLYLRVLITDLT